MPCENCHTNTSWKPIRAVPEFNHNSTQFPLRGQHEKVYCAACHFKPVFTDVGKNCADCHADIHRRQFGANCAECHTVQGWQTSVQSVKQHLNRFPLLGAHAVVECQECHKNAAAGQFVGLSTACASCHLADFQKTANPNHVAAKFPSTCETCHSFDTWLNAKFDHAVVGFPLTNGHANVPCASCHINNNYNLTIAATDCGNAQCHLTTWQQTNNPVHSTAGAPFAAANCSTCHTTVSWSIATFDHSATGFALTGMHVSPVPTPCISCHVNNNYTLNSTACYGCHLAAWQSTATLGGAVPNHISAGFPTDCSICHSTANWTTSSFNHNNTAFPLTGTHTTTPCASCHVNNNYTTVPTDCYSCHTADWQKTTTAGGPVPNHITLGYPTTCASCHTTTVWSGATFNHNATAFPLTGFHTTVACNLCHTSSTPPPTDCYSCHTADWQKTTALGGTVPNHIAAGFPTTCATCHTTTSWLGAVFNHTYFTIPHHSATCANCHINSTNYATFSCTASCHSQANTDPNHDGVSGYVYGPTTCYNCHKQ